MLQQSRKVRTLRSSDLDQRNVPRVRTAVGSRASSVAAPRLWNALPLEIRSAKTQIEDVFFWSGFSDLNTRWSVWPMQTTNAKGFWNYESDYKYVCRASELGSPGI